MTRASLNERLMDKAHLEPASTVLCDESEHCILPTKEQPGENHSVTITWAIPVLVCKVRVRMSCPLVEARNRGQTTFIPSPVTVIIVVEV